ncbi:hypothetical protein [Colwellia sp. UCD-KL20]|uniref:hypothetical protein n=1 Tax=Colwellia sp. UCD-KL20 TaxID=1917165 RepID=UPI001C4BF6E8|nr:hypothetical protein [Colwellia sp. UCD-KL20]
MFSPEEFSDVNRHITCGNTYTVVKLSLADRTFRVKNSMYEQIKNAFDAEFIEILTR